MEALNRSRTWALIDGGLGHRWASQVVLVLKNPPANAGDVRVVGLIPGWGRSPGEGNGYPLQYSCLENPMDRGAWWATVHGVAGSDTTEAVYLAQVGHRQRRVGCTRGHSLRSHLQSSSRHLDEASFNTMRSPSCLSVTWPAAISAGPVPIPSHICHVEIEEEDLILKPGPQLATFGFSPEIGTIN